MKKEATGKKSLLWLWITIAAVVVIAATLVVLFTTGVIGGKESKVKIESELYYNIDRAEMQDPETGLSLREPDADGIYRIRFAVGGEQVELQVADGKLVNKIDVQDYVCLQFDADGMIIEVYPPSEVYTLIAENAYVQNIDGENYLLNSSQVYNGMETSVKLDKNVGIYNVIPSRAEVPGRMFKTGEFTELGIMDCVTIFGTDENTPTDVFVSYRPYASKVYWRVSERMYDATNKCSSRPQAEDGYWYMDFTVDGETVTHRTNVQAVINALDGYGQTQACCMLVFNHEGDIVDCGSAAFAIPGKVAAINYNITTISEDGKTFTATRLFAGNEAGRTFSATLPEDAKVYNVTTTADVFGEETQLQEGDLTYIITDPMGTPKIIYVTNRYVDSPMYYNVSRKYNTTTKETTREPDANGAYVFTLAVKGEQKTFYCYDKKTATQMDAAGYGCFGLKTSGNQVLKYYDPACVSGNWSFAANSFVVSYQDPVISCESTAAVVTNGLLMDGCEVYDVSGNGEFKGVKTTVREGDRIVGFKDPQGTVTHIYITSRYEAGAGLYYNPARNTSLKKDADGFYNLQVVKVGQTGTITLKTDDQTIANSVNRGAPADMGLRVTSDGIITKVYPSASTIEGGGYRHLAGIHVLGYTEEGYAHCKYRTTGAEAKMNLEEATVYNFSGVYKTGPGEITSLQAGDRIVCLYSRLGRCQKVFVYERESGSEAYWLKSPCSISSATGLTTREPAEDDYYYFQVAVNGEVKTVKTKDPAIATKVDSKTLAFGMKLDGDVVLDVYGSTSTKPIWYSAQSYYDVTAINGNSITLERLTPGTSNTGDKQVIDISKATIYEVSQYADDDKWGRETTLKIGDRIQTYYDDNQDIGLVYVVWGNTHKAGPWSYCEHCGEEVFWHPYYGTIDFIDKHYYLTHDYTNKLSKGWGITKATKGYDWVLDLNGFTYEATDSYAFAIRGNSTLSVVDTSPEKTGRITGVGVQASVTVEKADGTTEAVKSQYQSSQAGIFQVMDNGTLNLYGGTYTRTVNREITNLRRAGVVMVNQTGTLNIYDGAKLVNNTIDTPLDLATTCPECKIVCDKECETCKGTVLKRVLVKGEENNKCKHCGWTGKNEVNRNPQGGAIYNNGGIVNIYGGEISGNGKIHEDYKKFESTVIGYGGNIFNATGELNIYGGKITNGWSGGNGGNIYVYGGKLNIEGGEISGGESLTGDYKNISVPANRDAEVIIAGGTITGDMLVGNGNTLSISGKPKISVGDNTGLFLGEGLKAKVSDMKSGAKIVISSNGVFTKNFASADAATKAKPYFSGVNKGSPIIVAGKALACGYPKCINGHTSEKDCKAANCKEEILYWSEWSDTDSLPVSGNYYLSKDVVLDSHVKVDGKLVLDLNGHNITRNVTKAQIEKAERTSAFEVPAAAKLTVYDLSGKAQPGTVKVNLPKDKNGKLIPTTSSQGIVYVATGSEVVINDGIYDGREMLTSSTASGGIFCGGGKLTVNGGTFYGWSYEKGTEDGAGTIFGGWSTSELTINDGTFYGGKVKQGGMFASSGKIVIKGGTFDGNADASGKVIDATKPKTEATHGGLIYAVDNANSSIEISGGTFNAPHTYTSGGMIYTSADAGGKTVMKITGGTFNMGKASNGGFIRFRGKSLEITGVTLKGATAATGDIIAFHSTGTLTIGKNAVIDGGIQMVGAGKVVLKDNAKINEGTNYGIKLIDGVKMDLDGLNKNAKIYVDYATADKAFATLKTAGSAKNLVKKGIIVSGDENYEVVADGKKLKIAISNTWKDWNKTDSLPTNGNYRLVVDVTVDDVTAVGNKLTLDLNGHNITRTVTEQQITNSEKTYIFDVAASKKLTITDLSGNATDGTVKVQLPKDADDKIIPIPGFYGMINVAAGSDVVIDKGIFDGRELYGNKVGDVAALFSGGGKLTINNGTFYGMSSAITDNSETYGSIFGGWSSSELIINGGTFYGGTVKNGGMFATTGKILVTGGTFDGNCQAGKTTAINAELPLTTVSHGGIFIMRDHANSNLEITGGTFTAGKVSGSGGIIYVQYGDNAPGQAKVTISGGTFQAGSKNANGGFIRFRGAALEITNVTLSGFAANTGNTITFDSAGTMTIGNNAVIDGGIHATQVKDKNGNIITTSKIILKDNAKINNVGAYAMNLNGVALDPSGLSADAKVYVNHTGIGAAFAEVADLATAQALIANGNIVAADGNYTVVADGNKLTVKLSGLPGEGNIVLEEDLVLNSAVVLSGELNVDLNGHNITRVVTEEQINNGQATYVFDIPAGKKLTITDSSVQSASDVPGTVKVQLPKDADDKFIPINSYYGMVKIAGGAEVVVENGIFDGRELYTKRSGDISAIFGASGKVTINGGIFYGLNNVVTDAETYGTIFGGWSGSELNITGGTFYGGTVKNGGMFATTGKVNISGGTFDGNTNTDGTQKNADLPQTVVTHGGIIIMRNNANSKLTISGGTFYGAKVGGSGGIVHAEANTTVTITDGDFYAANKTARGGFLRFCGKALSISNVTLEGFTSGTGDIIHFNTNGTLTIGADAVIDGGILMDATSAKLVLKDNAKINKGTNYAIMLGTATVDISALTDEAKVFVNYTDPTKNFTEAADEAAAQKLVNDKIIVSADPNYRVIADGKGLTVKSQIVWQDWDAEAAADFYGGEVSDNLHTKKLPTKGNWQLTANVETNEMFASEGNLNLNLNGKNITRIVSVGQTSNTYVLKASAAGEHTVLITDEIQLEDPTAPVGTVLVRGPDPDNGKVTVSSGCAMFYSEHASGKKAHLIIENGNFDGHLVESTSTGNYCGLIQAGGYLTIRGGTFQGIKAASGSGTVIGTTSTCELNITGGTFYGNTAKQGGILSLNGTSVIEGGVFDGNNTATGGSVDATKTRTYITTHGGLVFVGAGNLTIRGEAVFKANPNANSGGMFYCSNAASNIVIEGGTFTVGRKTVSKGGFIRCAGNLTLKNVTLNGFTATEGNIIAFYSAKTLTIGEGAVIDGGIQTNGTAGSKIVLVNNPQVNNTTGSYTFKLAATSVHLGSASNAAEVTAGSSLTTYKAVYDANGNLTGIQ